VKLDALDTASPVTELIAAGHLIFALTQAGACAAYCRSSNKRICYLNVKSDETIRSIFLNKQNDSIITVSVYKKDQYRQLRCRSTQLELIRRQQPELGIPVFVSECLKYPGFIEFDDSNSKVLTYSAVQTQYKLWDLVDYSLMFGITDPGVTEIKMSPGIMLLIYKQESYNVPLKMLAISDGRLLHDISCPVVPRKPVEFVEQSNGKILMKQLGENLTIYDVKTKAMMTVDNFSAPSAFIFLYINRLFLTFRGTRVSAWNFHGTQATKFVDHELFSPDASTNNNFISEDQHLLISYCKNKRKGRSKGSLNISHCVTGELIHKLDAPAESFYRSVVVSGLFSESSSTSSSSTSSSSSSASASATELVEMHLLVETPQSMTLPQSAADERDADEIISVESLDSTSMGAEALEALVENQSDRPRADTIASPSSRTSSKSLSSFTNDDTKRIEALNGVTAIFFNEDHSEIYTGNRQGHVWVWGH